MPSFIHSAHTWKVSQVPGAAPDVGGSREGLQIINSRQNPGDGHPAQVWGKGLKQGLGGPLGPALTFEVLHRREASLGGCGAVRTAGGYSAPQDSDC